MINLIPPTAEKSLKREYHLRVVAVWLFLFGTGALVVASLFLPSYMLVNTALESMTAQVVANSASVATFDNGTAALEKAMAEASLLADTATTTPTVSQYDGRIRTLAGNGVRITTTEYKITDATVTITVSGQADTRQSLANFKDGLELDSHFSNVTLPLSSLIKDRDLLFTMTVMAGEEPKP